MLEELSQILSPDEGMAMVPVKIRVPETLMHSSEGKLVVNYKVCYAGSGCGMDVYICQGCGCIVPWCQEQCL